MSSSADPRVAQAWEAAAKGDLDGADRLFELVSQGPSAAEAAFGRGSVAARRGDFTRAVDLLADACRLDPSVPVHHYQHGVSLVAVGRADAAARCFREAVRLDPSFGEAWFNLGSAERQAGRIEEAVDALRHAASGPKPIEVARLAIVQTLRGAGRVDEAISAAREAISMREAWAEAWSELGLCLAMKSDLRTAATCWERALEIQPRFLDARFHLGVVAGMLGEFDRAIEHYRAVTRAAPNHGRARVNLAGLLMLRGELAAAEAELLAATAQPGPDGAVITLALADLRLRQDRLPDAERLYRDVVRQSPRELRPRLGLVGTLVAQERGEEALREVEAIEAIAPGRPEVQEARCDALVMAGRPTDALPLIERLLASQGPTPLRHGLRGRVLEALGRAGDARSAYESALAMNPGFAPAADGLDRLAKA